MTRLFLPGVALDCASICIDGADAHHLLHVLRVRAAEPLVLLDNHGGAVLAEVAEIGKRALIARVLGPVEVAPEPAIRVTVAQAVGRGDRFEQVVQHGTEAGAAAFIPMVTERTVVRLDPREAAAKHARWSLVAKGAAEQSGRALIPPVHQVTPFADLLPRLGDRGACLLLHAAAGPETAGNAEPSVGLRDTLAAATAQQRSLLLLVGPEGGFSAAEVAAARQAGATVVSLGPHTLRTETAALVALSRIHYHFAELEP